jgi:hypothetical protein
MQTSVVGTIPLASILLWGMRTKRLTDIEELADNTASPHRSAGLAFRYMLMNSSGGGVDVAALDEILDVLVTNAIVSAAHRAELISLATGDENA